MSTLDMTKLKMNTQMSPPAATFSRQPLLREAKNAGTVSAVSTPQ